MNVSDFRQPRTVLIRVFSIALIGLLGACTVAIAADTCPSGDIAFPHKLVSYGVAGNGRFETTLTSLSCQEFWVEAKFTNGTNSSASVGLQLFGEDGTTTLLGSTSGSAPAGGTVTLNLGSTGIRIPNAVTGNGRLGRLWATTSSQAALTVDVTVHLVGRNGYNTAGEDFGSAVLVGTTTPFT
jgi:hypothetical protein